MKGWTFYSVFFINILVHDVTLQLQSYLTGVQKGRHVPPPPLPNLPVLARLISFLGAFHTPSRQVINNHYKSRQLVTYLADKNPKLIQVGTAIWSQTKFANSLIELFSSFKWIFLINLCLGFFEEANVLRKGNNMWRLKGRMVTSEHWPRTHSD